MAKHVSIPNRDFVELQSNIVASPMTLDQVSIPNRDFVELQSSLSALTGDVAILFQSLIGILLNCNSGSRKAKLYLVFKVRLRESRAIIALENFFGKSVGKS